MVNPHGIDGERLRWIVRSLMTDGAIRCRRLFAKVRPLGCHSRFPTIRRVPTGWLPRCGFKEVLRVVTPTRIPEQGGG
jgi:hypothetical protein